MKIDGLKLLQQETRSIATRLAEAEDPAAMAAAEPILARWQQLVPVLDANYRDALAIQWLKGEGAAAIGTRWMDSLPRNEQPLMYAKRLEIGDSEMAAQPSMQPALKAAQQEAITAGGVPIKTSLRGGRRRRVKA